ncbi:hypothetical protein N864_05185 [Intrasporangium chromatireducens Q5-1]|uniref:Fucose-specific lectin n=1 Tax=Intrasporangium chromatireducens Q5-1 TaxID=584657 RepID=W9GGY9_9MICO|nr:hypothetical protein [Intrasporangium chromatireducens]EWT05350.1 hypothetical protein N864_05185 [Intrasporangium chromatireducens Q5-1]
MTWFSNDLTVRTGAPPAIFSPSAYAFPRQKTQHILYQGFGAGAGDGHVHELWWDGHWHHNDLTSQSDAPPISGEPCGYVYEDQPGGWTQHAIYQGLTPGVGPDGRVQEIWWGDGKNHHQLTSGQPPLVDRPFGYSFEVGQHIVYRANNTLRFLDMEEDFGWLNSDLTPYLAGTHPSLPPTAYGFTSQRTHHLLYTGSDEHVHELWKGPSGGFHHNDLTASSKSSARAAGVPVGFANDPGNRQVVSYVATDGHLHQLTWDGSWHEQDLTSTVGGVAPSSGAVPTGYLYPSEGTLHVNYVGVDDHIHEYWQDGTGWHPNDLTTATGVLASRSNPAAYVMPDNTQHVVFVDDNRHVMELYWLP